MGEAGDEPGQVGWDETMKGPMACVSLNYPLIALGNRIFCGGVYVLNPQCPYGSCQPQVAVDLLKCGSCG